MSTAPKNKNCKTLIYVLKDPETQEIRYVGKTVKTLIIRLGEHIRDAKNPKINNHRSNWISSILNKNTLPIIEQIDECSWNDSQALEIYYINLYKSRGCYLVNETEGGEGTLGRQVSEKTRRKISIAARKHLEKVYQFDLNGILIKEWDNAPQAAEILGLSTSGITRCLRGERYKYKNFLWSYTNSDEVYIKYVNSKELQKERNKKKNKGGYTQSYLGRLISQESKLIETPFYYVYNNKRKLLYEGISANDIASFINNDIGRDNIDLNSRITKCIKNNTPYYDKYYISNKSPENYKNTKHKELIIVYYDKHIVYGIKNASEYFGISKASLINNLKNVTKTISTNFGKIKLNWKINIEHCRLYMKMYGLSAGELEEAAKNEYN